LCDSEIDILLYVKYVKDKLDVILEIDLLSAKYIHIYCGQQKIVFPNSSESEFMSTQQVWSKLKEGSSCFIILTQMGVKNEDEMSSILVLKEYVNYLQRERWNVPLNWYLELDQCQWDLTECLQLS